MSATAAYDQIQVGHKYSSPQYQRACAPGFPGDNVKFPLRPTRLFSSLAYTCTVPERLV